MRSRLAVVAMLVSMTGCALFAPTPTEADKVLVETTKQTGTAIAQAGAMIPNTSLTAAGSSIAENMSTLQFNLVGKPAAPVVLGLDPKAIKDDVIEAVAPLVMTSERARQESDADHGTDPKPDDPIPWYADLVKGGLGLAVSVLLGGGGVAAVRGRRAKAALAATIEGIQLARAEAGSGTGSTISIDGLLGHLTTAQTNAGTRHFVRRVKESVDKKINGSGPAAS